VLVRPLQQRLRDHEAKCRGGLEIDDELELGGLLDQKVGRLLTLENSPGIRCRPSHMHQRGWRHPPRKRMASCR